MRYWPSCRNAERPERCSAGQHDDNYTTGRVQNGGGDAGVQVLKGQAAAEKAAAAAEAKKKAREDALAAKQAAAEEKKRLADEAKAARLAALEEKKQQAADAKAAKKAAADDAAAAKKANAEGKAHPTQVAVNQPPRPVEPPAPGVDGKTK